MKRLPGWWNSKDYHLEDNWDEDCYPIKRAPLTKFPQNTQEQIVGEDLLNCLMGMSGIYITFHTETESFIIDKTVEDSMVSVINTFLPICSNYVFVSKFIKTESLNSKGLICKFVCFAMQLLLKEYLILVTQFEKLLREGQLTISRLVIEIEDAAKMMNTLYIISKAIMTGQCKGGAILNLLYELSLRGGDQETYYFLLQYGSKPYFEMMNDWIKSGDLVDPHKEFMIYEQPTDQNQQNTEESYLQNRFSIVDQNVFCLMKDCVHKIVNIGKYVRIIQQSDKKINMKNVELLEFSLEENYYIQKTNEIHSITSKNLLNLLQDRHNLYDVFSHLKAVYLFGKKDIMDWFWVKAEEHLKKVPSQLSLPQLQIYLDTALSSSSYAQLFPDDKNLYSFSCILNPTSRTKTEPKVKDVFSLEYSPKWPVSLILSKTTITKYQTLFHLLFLIDNVARQVRGQLFKNLCHLVPIMVEARAFLRQMLHFVRCLEEFVIAVIDSCWDGFMKALKKVDTVDALVEEHEKVLDKCLGGCLISNSESYTNITRLLDTCLAFSDLVRNINETLAQQSKTALEEMMENLKKDEKLAKLSKFQLKALAMKKLPAPKLEDDPRKIIQKFRNNFNHYLKILIAPNSEGGMVGVSLKANAETETLASIMDRSGFYLKIFNQE